jgi:magnesium chelatase subunit D
VTAFPFTAIVGQDDLREALLACAVDPAIGGVLVRGERGTAKTTAVRGLTPLLPPVRVREGDRYAADPDLGEVSPDGESGHVVSRAARLVELPVGATADRVLGTLDLERALSEGERAFQPGLLASAHRGVLYVDEVNLLPDHLVDVLLDAAALGRNHVERDGLSVSHTARFLLVGTMNPEEGELRPQLLDRFGLSVQVAGSADPQARTEIIRRRLAFDRGPAVFTAAWAEEERALAARVAAARGRLAAVRLPERMLGLIAGTCARLGVDGHRADIVCARAAVALAAIDGAEEVGQEHVRRAARLALAHRRRRGPLEAPGLDERELDDALAEAGDDEPEPDPSPNGGPEGHGPPPEPDPPPEDPGPGAHDDAPPRAPSPDPSERPYRAEAPSRERMDAPDAPGRAPLLALAGRGEGASGRRSRAAGGQPVDSREPDGDAGDLALAATLRAAIGRRALDPAGPPLARTDLREHVRAGREGNLVVFCVDASGSMGAQRRMSRIKGAILGLLTDAYQRRDRVALVTFRGEGAQVALSPTGSVERAGAALDALPTGGGTPLAAGLDEAERLVRLEGRRDPTRRALVLIVTDGRASGGAAGRAAAAQAAQRLAGTAAGVVVFDGEQGAVRLGLAGELAAAAGARLLPLSALDPPTRSAA